MPTAKPKRVRKPTPFLYTRCSEADVAAVKLAALRAGISVNAWVLGVLQREAQAAISANA